MPHPGITFALAVGVALGALIYYLIPNWEQPHEHDDDGPSQPPVRSWDFTNNERNSNIRRRRPHNGNCSICLNNVAEGAADSKKLKCSHVFHERCIQLWFRQKSECPNCRMPVNCPSDIIAHQ